MFLTPQMKTYGDNDKIEGRFVAGGHRQDRSLFEDCERSISSMTSCDNTTILPILPSGFFFDVRNIFEGMTPFIFVFGFHLYFLLCFSLILSRWFWFTYRHNVSLSHFLSLVLSLSLSHFSFFSIPISFSFFFSVSISFFFSSTFSSTPT